MRNILVSLALLAGCLAAQPVITKSDVLNGTVGTAYTYTMTASGGTSPYTWTISAGSLPTGLTLSSAGVISGTPTTFGWSNFFTIRVTDAAAATTTLQYSMLIYPATDIYGGMTSKPCATGNGKWHFEQNGLNWFMCDPANNLYWYQGLSANLGSGGNLNCDPGTGQCYHYDTIVAAKYPNDATRSSQYNLRAQLWGFNNIGQKSWEETFPYFVDANFPGPSHTQPIKMSITPNIEAGDALTNAFSYAPDATKDMADALNEVYYIQNTPPAPDLFDPNIATWETVALANNLGFQAFINTPYVSYWIGDDIDFVSGFAAGPELQSVPAYTGTGNNGGLIVMLAAPTMCWDSGRQLFYTNCTFMSKVAGTPPTTCSTTTPCTLRDFLAKKYGTIGALNTAWGGTSYTTFDSTGTRITGEVVATGDGTTTTFTHTLAHTHVDPYSTLLKNGSTKLAGDCPGFRTKWGYTCGTTDPTLGVLTGPGGSGLKIGLSFFWGSPGYTTQPCAGACSTPSGKIWVQLVPHIGAGGAATYFGNPTTPQFTNIAAGDVVRVNNHPVCNSLDAACIANVTGYDVYAGFDATPLVLTLQASNVSLTADWTEPDTGLVTGTTYTPPVSIVYGTGVVTLAFSTAPALGASITLDYTHDGWGTGTGLMDEDGRHTATVGTNPWCIEAALQCDGVGLPVSDANATFGADIDEWLGQYAASYFKLMKAAIAANDTTYGPRPWCGSDTLGDWGAPAFRTVLQGAAPWLDCMFVSVATARQDMIDYIYQYFGNKPLVGFMTTAANPDSALSLYTNPNAGYAFTTQPLRGQNYLSLVQYAQTFSPTGQTFHPFAGMQWWANTDFWNEKIDWGLTSLQDNPYDGKGATTIARTDPWGFSTGGPTINSTTGGELANYGDALDYIKQANALWWALGTSGPTTSASSVSPAGSIMSAGSIVK